MKTQMIIAAAGFSAVMAAGAANAKQYECAAWQAAPGYQLAYHGIFDGANGRLKPAGEADVTIVATAQAGPARLNLMLGPDGSAIFSTPVQPKGAKDLFLTATSEAGQSLGRFRIIPPTAGDDGLVAQLDPALGERLTQSPVVLAVEADGAVVQTYRFDLSAIAWKAWRADREAVFTAAADVQAASGDDASVRHCAPVVF